MFQPNLHQRLQACTDIERAPSAATARDKENGRNLSLSATIKYPQHSASIVNEMISSFSPVPWRQKVRPYSAFPARTSQSSSLQTENSSDTLLEIETEVLRKMLDVVHRENAVLEKERRRLQEQLENLRKFLLLTAAYRKE